MKYKDDRPMIKEAKQLKSNILYFYSSYLCIIMGFALIGIDDEY